MHGRKELLYKKTEELLFKTISPEMQRKVRNGRIMSLERQVEWYKHCDRIIKAVLNSRKG